ncbi:MAG: helix-turn-helix transcriptional regulator [Eubacterium sp.]|nr:helix-turn-helix transcriptional regulator [Eubacterium sp.]
MKIGTRLRQYRNAKGFSIYKLSRETYISQNHISAIENDRRQPTIETLERLIAPMGITLAELFNDNENASFLTPDERELVENYRSMPKESAELLFSLGKVLSNKGK